MKRHLVLVYWLLLLVSTLAIGAVAFYLLQRESEHLRQVAADSAVGNGMTMAANCEAVVQSAKSSSMDALSKFQDAGILQSLYAWRKDAPYNSTVFLYQPGSGLVLPEPFTQERADLMPLVRRPNGGWVWGSDFGQTRVTIATSSLHGPPSRGGGRFGQPPGPPPGPPPDNRPPRGPDRSPNRDVANANSNPGNPPPAPAFTATLGFNGNVLTVGSDGMTVTSNGLPVTSIEIIPSGVANVGLDTDGGNNTNISNFTMLQGGTVVAQIQANSFSNGAIAPSDVQLIVNQQTFDFVPSNRFQYPTRPDHGWVQVGPPDNVRWLGWMRPNPGGPVRGLLMDWAPMAKAFSNALNGPMDSASGYILRNPAGEAVALHFANGSMVANGTSHVAVDDPSAKPLNEPLTKLPLDPATMPGWVLEVYFDPSNTYSSFMAVNTVLVAILVITVLVGGTLLLREARREASEAARKTSFVSNVSHELKTPLTTIRMYAELLGEGRVRDETKQRNYLATIIGESQRLTRLVNNVLDFSRLEQGRKQYHPDDLALAPVIESVLEAQRPRLEEAGFTIETDFPPGRDVRVRVDRDALEQVLINLIDNAMKYASSGRWLGIRIGEDGERATITVSDRGPGVPAEHQERIFQMFHRVDDSITSKLPGAGLGLSIARRLLRDQEGDLNYEPNEPRGSSFVATLPLASNISAAKIA